ncbi:MAG: 2-C-methyl-D-erythritol 2,4-cyclodiphosphate synthase [Oscillospiraceae bacterium]|nr:2-C-methyl-D-erythritol 2,4-cyclodiphosphate synthase [Oscillospiraceae bacterium]
MIRIGHGYDVHKLVEGRRLILGGMQIPYEKGLLGHSDADVLTHAVADALLGALALPNIGIRFPDSDERYKDANSIELLKNVYSEVLSMGYKVCNLDCTVIAEKPMLKPFIYPMRKVLSETLSTDIENVNVKATTEEGLGLRGEGIGAHALVLLEKE